MSRASRFGKLVAGSVVIGGSGAAIMYRHRLKENRAITAIDYNASQNTEQVKRGLSWVRQTADARAAKRPTAELLSGPKLELFRYTTCPFCGKVKAFLDYYGVPHELVEVEPMFKKQIGESHYKKLPQLRFGGEDGAYLVDSDIIVDTLAELVGVGSQLEDSEVQKWRTWCRESLVRHVTLNINKSLIEAWRGYSYIDDFDTIPFANKMFLKLIGAPVMYMVATFSTRKTLIKRGELNEGDDYRTVFHQQVDRYVNEANISMKRPFHGGSKPDLVDLEVYGVLNSIRGHAVFDDLLHNTKIKPWMIRMDSETGKSAYALDCTESVS